MKIREHVVFYLNGVRTEAGPEHARMMLADYLRYARSLTGTKIVCAEGDCGACSVLRFVPGVSKKFVSINSCITTVAQMDGSSIVTVDALAKGDARDSENFTPIQKSMVSCHGSQCGFCTPGFIVALTAALEEKKTALTPQEAKNACTGNLCRCTGYQPIIDAAVFVEASKNEPVSKRFYSRAQELELKAARKTALLMKSDSFEIFAPVSLKDAVKFLSKNKDVRIIGAGTDLGVVSNKGKLKLTKLLSLHLAEELYAIKKSAAGKEKRLTIGARVTLTELRNALKGTVPEFARFLDLFASPQIKNAATLVGNIGNASPIADTPPSLFALNAKILLTGPKGKRAVPIDAFYLGYRKTAIKPGELIYAIDFAIPGKDEEFRLLKASQRKDLDISAVNAAFRLKRVKGKITGVILAYGGVAATPIRLKKTEKFLLGKTLNEETILKAQESLQSEMTPLSDVRGTAAFRKILAKNFFTKFMREIQ